MLAYRILEEQTPPEFREVPDPSLSWRGRMTMVGAAGGSIPFDFFKIPPGAQLTTIDPSHIGAVTATA